MTAERLAAALRDALTDCQIDLGFDRVHEVHVSAAGDGHIRCRLFGEDDPPGNQYVEVDWIEFRADRDLARRVMTVLDQMEETP